MIDGELVLIDEVLTPDSSRFWPADSYAPVHLRFHTTSNLSVITSKLLIGIKHSGPQIPADILNKSCEKYLEVYEVLTGELS